MRALIKIPLLALSCAALIAGCSDSGSDDRSSSTAGSRARMTQVGDYLYAISGAYVQLLDISAPESPNLWNRVRLEWDIETLFPYEDYLLVGSETGVYILDNTDLGNPRRLSDFTHARSCDPVVAESGVGFVTLNANRNCWSDTASNQLDVLDLSDMSDPQLIETYPLQDPGGLAVQGQWLYVCDGRAGLKVFDKTDPADLSVREHLPSINCYDVIAKDDTLYVSTSNALLQYDIGETPMALISELRVDD